MTQMLTEWFEAIWMVLAESGPYLLVGFAIAGFLAVFVPTRWVARRLGGDDTRSVATAALIGVPIPLCSCSVIPTATQLRRSGASRGATTSFLISTPETGVDSIGATWALAKMNLFLHGEDNHRVEWGDSIRNPKLLDASGGLMHFDVVTANPPFSLEKWGIEQAERDKFGRFQRGLPPKTKGDYAFILHMIETLKPDTGRMGVVVPHGVLFRGGSEGKIRQALIEENLLDAVIGLPEKLFFGTGIPAAILLFRKAKSGEDVLFIDASRDFVAGKNQNQLGPQQLERIVAAYRARQHQSRYAEPVSLQTIRDNDYSLNIPRYVDTFEAEEEIDLLAIKAEREELERELTALKREMDGYLTELGYE